MGGEGPSDPASPVLSRRGTRVGRGLGNVAATRPASARPAPPTWGLERKDLRPDDLGVDVPLLRTWAVSLFGSAGRFGSVPSSSTMSSFLYRRRLRRRRTGPARGRASAPSWRVGSASESSYKSSFVSNDALPSAGARGVGRWTPLRLRLHKRPPAAPCPARPSFKRRRAGRSGLGPTITTSSPSPSSGRRRRGGRWLGRSADREGARGVECRWW